MDVKPEKWVDPEVLKEQRLLEVRIYFGKHWHRGSKSKRALKPEVVEWLETFGFPYRAKLIRNGGSKIIFQDKAHAAAFKLAWM